MTLAAESIASSFVDTSSQRWADEMLRARMAESADATRLALEELLPPPPPPRRPSFWARLWAWLCRLWRWLWGRREDAPSRQPAAPTRVSSAVPAAHLVRAERVRFQLRRLETLLRRPAIPSSMPASPFEVAVSGLPEVQQALWPGYAPEPEELAWRLGECACAAELLDEGDPAALILEKVEAVC